MILISTDLGHVLSFRNDGHLLWNIQIVNRTVKPTVPVGYDGTIYYAIGDHMGALDEAGHILWQEVIIGDEMRYPPSISVDGGIYFTSGRDLLCFNENGIRNWTYRFDSDTKSPAVVDDAGSILVTSGGSNEIRLNYISSNGSLLWDMYLGNEVDPTTAVVLPNGNISFSPHGGDIHIIMKNGSFETIPFALYRSAYYYVTPNYRSFLMGSSNLYIDNEDWIGTMGYFNRLAFSKNGMYFTSHTLYRISFSDIPHNSFAFGPIKDRRIKEDHDLFINPTGYFEISPELAKQTTYTLELEQEEYATLNYRSNGSYFIEPIPDFNGILKCRFEVKNEYDIDPPNPPIVCYTHSNWFDIIVESVNDPPYIVEHFLPDGYQNTFYSATVHAEDIDSDVDRLTYRLETEGFLYMRGNKLEGEIPFGMTTGRYDLRIRITDPEGWSISTPVSFEIKEKDEPPCISIEHITMSEDNTMKLDIGCGSHDEIRIDDPDGNYDHIYEVEPGPGLTVQYISLDYIRLEPDPDWFGDTWFIFKVTDGTGSFRKKGEVTVRNEMDQVNNLRIVPLSNLTELTTNDPVILTAAYDDPDMGEYDIEFEWSSNITYMEKRTDCTAAILNTTLPEGHHRITVHVLKEDDHYNKMEATAYIDLEVKKGKDPFEEYLVPDVEEPDFLKDLPRWILIHSLVLLYLVLAPFILFAVRVTIRKRIRRGKETPDRPSEVKA